MSHSRSGWTHGLWSIGALLSALVIGGCGTSVGDQVPADLKARIPKVSALRVSLPGKAGPQDSPGAAMHELVAELNRALKPLSLLGEYLEDGGEVDRDVALVINLVSPPHVADLAVRYRQGGSRLDVERFGDHAFFYLQVPQNGRYQPDEQIDETGMLVDGGSVLSTYGQRPQVTGSKGRADANRGYLRVQFNQRESERDPVNQSVHIDYDLQRFIKAKDAEGDYIAYSFYRRPEVQPADGQLRGVVYERREDGGAILVSESRNGKARWRWRASFSKDGFLKVLGADGKVAACYDSSGTELGNTETPEPCAEIEGRLPGAPKVAGVFP